VVHVLDARRISDEGVWDSHRGTIPRAHFDVAGGRGRAYRGLHRAQVRGAMGELEPCEEALHGLEVSVQGEAHDSSVTSGHLSLRDFVLRMRLEARVVYARHG